MQKKIVVVKFGGSCLSGPENIKMAAKKVLAESGRGRKIVVVVSALSGVTDRLLKTALEASAGSLSPAELDEILARHFKSPDLAHPLHQFAFVHPGTSEKRHS